MRCSCGMSRAFGFVIVSSFAFFLVRPSFMMYIFSGFGIFIYFYTVPAMASFLVQICCPVLEF